MVQPLLADLLTRALAHGLGDEVAGGVDHQAVEPDGQLVGALLLEVGLAVDRPGLQPGRVAGRDDAAGDHAAGVGVPLADALDVGRDAVVERGDRGRLPGRLVLRVDVGGVDELVRPPEVGVLTGDVLPQLPAVARLDLVVPRRRGGVVTPAGVGHEGAVGDEHQGVLVDVDAALLSAVQPLDAAGRLALGGDVEDHVGDAGVELHLHALVLEPAHERLDEGLVLVVLGELQGGEVRQAADVVDEALDVELHLEGGVPLLEGEHRAPVEPEVGGEEALAHHLVDALVVQVLLTRHDEVQQVLLSLQVQGELAVGVPVLAAVLGGPHEGVVRVVLVEPVELVQDGGAFHLEGGDGAEQVPQALEVVLHLAAAADQEAVAMRVRNAVQGAAGDVARLEDGDVLAGHLAVADEEARRGQGGQAGTHQVGLLLLHALRLAGAGERLVVAAAVVHAIPPGLDPLPPCIAGYARVAGAL